MYAAEPLGELQPCWLCRLPSPFLCALPSTCTPNELAGVHAQGIVLQPQRGTDLHVGVGVLAAPQEDFLHQVGLQPLFLEKLGVVVRIAGIGRDGLKGHQPAHAMVAVGVGLGAPRVDAHHHVGPVLAYGPRDPLAELVVVLKGAVGYAQEGDLGDAHDVGSLLLFTFPYHSQPLPSHLRVTRALVAVGAKDVVALRPLADPSPYGATAPTFGIVRMGRHQQSGFRRVVDDVHEEDNSLAPSRAQPYASGHDSTGRGWAGARGTSHAFICTLIRVFRTFWLIYDALGSHAYSTSPRIVPSLMDTKSCGLSKVGHY